VKLKVNKIYKINNVYDPWDHLVYYVKITGPALLYVYPVDWPSIEEVSSLEQELL